MKAKVDKVSFVKMVIDRLRKEYPDARVALQFSTPFQLLVATILSAQCTDERVNKVTPGLFSRYPDAKAFSRAPLAEIEDAVRSTGFFRNKAKNIIGAARMVESSFNGQVPSSMEELIRLPGVARKTANIVLGNAYNKKEGIAVDTHVIRLAGRLGLSRQKDPVKIEMDLMAVVPREEWTIFSLLLQTLGRRICVARTPRHAECCLRDICPEVLSIVPEKRRA